MHYKYSHMQLFDGVPKPDFSALSGNLVIYGAGFQGLLAAHLLNKQGIRVLCFGDQDVKKQGTIYYGLPVYSPEEMKRRYPDAVPIVTPYNLRPAYEYVKKELGYANAITPFSLFLEFDSEEFDKLPELPAWYHHEALDYNVNMFLKQCINLLTKHPMISVEFSVSEICNLRCKNCTSLMPCYQQPKAFSYEDVLYDMMTVLDGRLTHHILIEGGEPFLWKPLPKLLRSLCELPNLLNIHPVTNGTVIPDNELLSALRHPKISVRISDYGTISKKNQLIPILQNSHIKYIVQLQKWFELCTFSQRPQSGNALYETVADCCKLGGNGAQYVMDGLLFRCPIQANLHRLGIFKSDERDYINLRCTDKDLQSRISDYVNVQKMPEIVRLCRHCNGRGYTGIEVPPAEQLAPCEKIQVRFE